MTGDELVAALYAEQGYLCCHTRTAFAIGEIGPHERLDTPMRVVGPSTRDEVLKQRRLAKRIAPDAQWADKGDVGPYFYRLEACD